MALGRAGTGLETRSIGQFVQRQKTIYPNFLALPRPPIDSTADVAYTS
jgi:hypothetical protein